MDQGEELAAGMGRARLIPKIDQLVGGLLDSQPVGCQKSIVAVTSRYRPIACSPSSVAVSVVWSFVDLAPRRSLEDVPPVSSPRSPRS
jgi:hypothetical protein